MVREENMFSFLSPDIPTGETNLALLSQKNPHLSSSGRQEEQHLWPQSKRTGYRSTWQHTGHSKRLSRLSLKTTACSRRARPREFCCCCEARSLSTDISDVSCRNSLLKGEPKAGEVFSVTMLPPRTTRGFFSAQEYHRESWQFLPLLFNWKRAHNVVSLDWSFTWSTKLFCVPLECVSLQNWSSEMFFWMQSSQSVYIMNRGFGNGPLVRVCGITSLFSRQLIWFLLTLKSDISLSCSPPPPSKPWTDTCRQRFKLRIALVAYKISHEKNLISAPERVALKSWYQVAQGDIWHIQQTKLSFLDMCWKYLQRSFFFVNNRHNGDKLIWC